MGGKSQSPEYLQDSRCVCGVEEEWGGCALQGCFWLHQLRGDKAVLQQHEEGAAHSGFWQLAETDDSIQRLLSFASKDMIDILYEHATWVHDNLVLIQAMTCLTKSLRRQ